MVVPVPPPSADVRAAMLKLLATEAEAARAAVRRVRKDALDAVKKGAGALSEDEVRRREKEVQTLTDACVKEVGAAAADKEAEIKATI